MMRRDIVFAQSFAQVMSDPLRQPPGVDEHQRGTMLLNQFHQPVVNLVPHFVGGDRAELAGRALRPRDRACACARHRRSTGAGAAVAGQEMSHFFDRLLGGGKADAHRRTISQRLQPLQRKRQVRAALVVGHGVDFVDDDGFDIAQNRAALFRGQQNVERLGRRDQNVRRPLQHGPALMHQRVAGADRGANLRHQQAALARHLQNLAQRPFEIFLDVVAQRLQRRDIQHFGAVVQITRQRLAHQTINAGQKRGQRLAGAGGGGDERGAPGENVRPALLLGLGRRAELSDKPLRTSGWAQAREEGRKTSEIF